MKGLTTLFAVALFAVAAFMAPATARAAVVTNISVPISIAVFIPCAGEVAVLSGPLHILATSEADEAGGFHSKFHFQPEGVSGTGLMSGDKYQGTGVTQGEFNVKPPFPFETTFVNNFRIIGQGPGNNFLVHANTHLTVNANGDVTATVGNFSADCK